MVLFDIKCITDAHDFNELEYTTLSLATAIQVFRTYYYEIEKDTHGNLVAEKNEFEKWINKLYSSLSKEHSYEYFVADINRVFFSIEMYEAIDIEDDIPAIVKEDMYEEVTEEEYNYSCSCTI